MLFPPRFKSSFLKALATIVIAALHAGFTPATAQVIPYTDPDGFYSSIPSATNTAPGTVLSQRDVSPPALDVLVKMKRIAYTSTHPNGFSTPVTGAVLTPTAPWHGPGPRPVALLAPGTQGAGDSCAPSKLLTLGGEYEMFSATALLSRGWTVALTDYQGLGTPGNHSYMNRKAQGAALLDLGRAVTTLGLPEVNNHTPLIPWGYSQGGGASAAAAEMHRSYAPDVNIALAYAGGVPANLLSVSSSLEGTALTGALGYVITGMYEIYPEVREPINTLLNTRGQQWLDQSSRDCLPESLLTIPLPDTSILTVSGQRLTSLISAEVFQRAISEQEIGLIAPDVPVFVAQGLHDGIIPAGQARDMVNGWRDRGADVTYWEDPAPALDKLLGHIHVLGSSFLPAVEWAEQRLAMLSPPTP
ncbi:lipase family protein [Corynebacterium ulcerans]|uniref:lipase family protein n=1 Tax=Corynebacterium ulcerans TaxID=65058 RepID=UPI0002141999|nr:lipase family protein [Corynebacterium ulcerans]AEG84735.1 putative secreted protein [Corynebacterium ulcerans BR-AD22]NOL58113.1 lipase [Corynebacterium ulcerans]NOM02744.1 lipase [Corynebacterium ulcerans]